MHKFCINVNVVLVYSSWEFIFWQVTRVVLLWVNNHFNDFETETAMAEFLEKFELLLEREVSSRDTYRKVSNIRRTLVDNKIVDHSDVVGASPVGAAPTTSSFST